jgi:hypothetical protein
MVSPGLLKHLLDMDQTARRLLSDRLSRRVVDMEVATIISAVALVVQAELRVLVKLK